MLALSFFVSSKIIAATPGLSPGLGHPPNLLCAKTPSSQLLLTGSIPQRGALEPSGNLPVLRPL
jgi:hypothetical protein